MAHIPFSERSIVARPKAVYLLDRDHPENRGKADFFASFGFHPDRPEELAAALLATASWEVAKTLPRDQGTRYDVEGVIATPDGRQAFVKVGWWIDEGGDVPRLASAVPGRRPR